jgi:hypothetical protein
MRHPQASTHPDESTPPCIFDVNLAAVDPERDAWISVSKRNVSAAPGAIGCIESRRVYEQHPDHRKNNKAAEVFHFTDYEKLPEWIRKRIAVLNMAPPEVPIAGIGMRWYWVELERVIPHLKLEHATIQDKRYYTLEWNCRRKGALP